MWQAFRNDVHRQGVEIVTVGLDTAGAEACRPYIEAAVPEHPSLIDEHHRVAELFGVVNIPNAVWIDEDGMIVRPAEPAPAPPSLGVERAASLGDMTEVPRRVIEIRLGRSPGTTPLLSPQSHEFPMICHGSKPRSTWTP